MFKQQRKEENRRTMGKSSSSCFKLVSCGGDGDSTDDERLVEVESQASSDKRRWSFRKRSARHRVLSNSVISETLSVSYNKEKSEATTNNFGSPINLSIPEKAHIQENLNEAPPLSSAVVNSGEADTLSATKAITSIDNDLKESVAIVIQAAIRGCLARKEVHKVQNVVKLQAAIRGHLVRSQAVGTLRCMHAIIEMQTLVRARYGRQSVGKLVDQESGKHQMNNERSTPLGRTNTCIKTNKTCALTEKLLSNGFACQLLESTLKKGPIKIKCDPSRPDSTWQWLERWMAVTSDLGQILDYSIDQDSRGQEENSESAAYDTATQVAPTVVSVSADAKLIHIESGKPAEDERDLMTKTSRGNELQAPLKKHVEYRTQLENDISCTTKENSEKMKGGGSDSISSDQMILHSSAAPKSVLDSSSDKLEANESPRHNAKRVPSEPLEKDGKRFALGSRKSCSPAFVAAQSKFEELSSTHAVGRATKSTSRDVSIESKFDSMHTHADSLSRTENPFLIENSESHDLRVQVAASECGTEISITSTLDSPDRSEAEGGEIVLEIGSLEKAMYGVKSSVDNAIHYVNVNAETNNGSLGPEVHQVQKFEHVDENEAKASVATVAPVQEEKQGTARTTSEVHAQMENPIDQQIYRSPEASPRSRTTAPESHGTPSSQTSVNTKKSKKNNGVPTRKQRFLLVGKKSPSNVNTDSGEQSSTEHLPENAKNAKRQTSFGTTKPDYVDHEPRMSNSSSLPSYMQATESARAKATVSTSPKSSPNVHDKDSYLKKRHSLPMANGKQESSPRMQRSTSQAQQNSKGNGTHSPHNSAERRWQR